MNSQSIKEGQQEIVARFKNIIKQKEVITLQERIKNQIKLVEETNRPLFAPKNGTCWCCNKNIYQDYDNSKGHDGTVFITGCPHCNRSFC